MNIFVAPKSCSKLETVKYPHTKRPQEIQCYLYDEENLTLYEVVKYADQYRSWFVDNLLCQEGHMNFLTRINPLFIFLPQLMNFARDQFRSLHDICQTFSSTPANQNFSRLDYALSPTIQWGKVCDTREIDDELFVRFSESKTLDWLCDRHKQTVAALAKEQPANTSRANLILEASDLIELYIPVSLVNKFKTLVRNDASAGMLESKRDIPIRPTIAGGTKRTAPVGGSPLGAVAGKSAVAEAKPKFSKPAESKNTGIMNFFKPVDKRQVP